MFEERKINGDKYLFSACLALHMQNTGVIKLRDDYGEDISLLEQSLLNWRKSKPGSEAFDNAVKNLIEVTLRECGSHLFVNPKEVVTNE